MQEEVATILAFGGPAADAAKAVGVTLTVDGVVPAENPDPSDQTDPSNQTEPSPNPEPTPTDDVPAS
jgi:hypothetical protein